MFDDLLSSVVSKYEEFAAINVFPDVFTVSCPIVVFLVGVYNTR